MKRKSLLFLMLMAMFAPLAMNGQTQNQLLSENFDNMSSISTSYSSTGCYAYNAGNGKNWTLNTSSSYANSGSNSAMYEYHGTYDANCYLVSAPFSVSSNMSELSVSLYERVRGSGYAETFEVFFIKASDVTSAASVASATHYSAIASASYTNTTFAQKTGSVTNSALAGQSVRVVVHCTSVADRWYLYIDDITVTETLEEACPKPTGLTATNLTPTSATLNWEGDAESYNVRYRKVIGESQVFFDGFENGIGNWTTVANSYSSTATNWRQFNAENFVDDDGNPTMFNHTGSYVAMSRSYGGSSVGDQTVDNWLISPQVTLDGVLKYWVINDDGADYVEHYSIYVSTSGTSTGNFTLLYEPTSSSTAWTEHTVDLSSFNGATGYIAFRHNDTGKDFLLIDDVSINAVQYSAWTTESVGSNSFNITGLDPESTYQVQVQSDCGSEDGTSAWSTGVIFETTSACSAPTGLSSTDVLAASAALNWVGYQDSYDVRYKPAYFEGFEDGIPSTWTTIDSDGDGNNWLALSEIPTVYPYYSSTVLGWAHSGNNAASSSSYANNVGGGGTAFSSNQWLISPNLHLDGTLKFYAASTYADEFEVLLSTTGTDISDFTTTLRAMTAVSTNSGWDEISINLSSYAGQHGYIAIHHVFRDGYFLIIDDFSISNDSWEIANASTNTLTITGLDPSTSYLWQVQGIDCDGNGTTTDWSASATFTTPEGYVKHITGHTNQGGYYLIASPIGTVAPTQVTNMITPKDGDNNTYDLYRFDQNPEDGLEWRNYRQGTFDLNVGQGYLYAHRTDVDLVFTGSAISGSNYAVPLTKSASASGHEFPDWNLVGNPFADVAHIDGGHAFYTLDVSGAYTLVSDASSTIESMQGVFVVAGENEESITFVKGEPSKKSPKVTLNVSKGTEVGVIDRAIVCFGETRQMPKFQLFKNSTKVYIPMEGKDYALVRGEEMGAMPVNFKAEENGTYSMNFSCENVGFAYLHLIDNKTGNDVDLLKTPSYSFEAKTTDYESRFKLVFATGDNSNDDSFAFFSNGSFVINNDGAAELQVIDLMGRILSSETINGCANVNVNAAPGVYMLRLINGDNVKVQKVVVK